MFTRCSFDKKENKLNYNRGKDCIKKIIRQLHLMYYIYRVIQKQVLHIDQNITTIVKSK